MIELIFDDIELEGELKFRNNSIDQYFENKICCFLVKSVIDLYDLKLIFGT